MFSQFLSVHHTNHLRVLPSSIIFGQKVPKRLAEKRLAIEKDPITVEEVPLNYVAVLQHDRGGIKSHARSNPSTLCTA